MPIKFPKFSRRKSVGNPLEAAYEPANPGNHFTNSPDTEERDSGPEALGSGYGGIGGQPRPNRGSGNTSGSGYSSVYYGDSNRLSSSSTLPSSDAPRTPDDYRPQLPDIDSPYGGSKSLRPASTFVTTTSSPMRSAVNNHLRHGPRTNSMTATVPPRLDTSLDTSSLFGEDMFDFNAPKQGKDTNSQVTPTAPKLASNAIINTRENHYDIPPVPPPKSYNPATSPTAARFGESSTSTYTNIFASSQHMDSDRSGNESSPYHWEPPGQPDLLSSSGPNNNSPRTSRNLTPGQTIPTSSHSRKDSLNAPPSRSTRNSRLSGASSGGSVDSTVLKRTSAVRRQSFAVEDEDAVIVAGAAVSRHGGYESGSRPQANHSNSPPPTLGSAVRGISDKVKDRDSGWEEALPSGSASSSNNSVRADSWSASSKDTTVTSPMMSRGNTEQDVRRGGIESNNTTPRAKKSGLVGVELNDGNDDADFEISAAAALITQYEDTDASPRPPAPTKVMTRAQFELLQKQQDDQRRLSGKIADDDSDVSDSEEDVETERNKEAVRQRAKQDAHLSVYRQQMMKVTGTQSELPLGMSRPASMSTSALPLPLTAISGPSSSGKSSEEEDEEIPLGILMAHGFPNKNRPPTRLSNASSQPNLRALAQNQQDPRLPPFARNLPADPYNIGASIVNPTNRMSLAFSAGGGPGSVAGGSMYNSVPPSDIPGRGPKGLVGEIVRAEEMKAARKGHMQYKPAADPFKVDPFNRSASPSGGGMLGFGGGAPQNGGGMGMQGMGPQGMGPQGMGSQGMMGQSMGMETGAGMGSGANPADQMQLQMANQMQQMMQMQMQWMQMQMRNTQQQQQQMPTMPQIPQMPQIQPPQLPQQSPQPPMFAPGMIQQPRPNSMASMNNPQMNGMSAQQPRTMSMVNPPQQFPMGRGTGYAPSIAPSQLAPTNSGGGFLGPQGYTPSIAPSERSNIGMPSRYRPVSYQPPAQTGARTSTLTSAVGNDWQRKSPGPSHLRNAGDSDDDDETGWEELNKRRKEKKDGWRKKKETGLKGMLHFGTTADTTA